MRDPGAAGGMGQPFRAQRPPLDGAQRLLRFFRIAWIIGCLLVALVLIVLAFVEPSSQAWFGAIAVILGALPAGLWFLKFARGRIEKALNSPRPPPPLEHGETPSEPVGQAPPDRFFFARRVHFPRKAHGDFRLMIYKEGGLIQILLLGALFGLGVAILAALPQTWAHAQHWVATPIHLAIGLIFLLPGILVFLRLRVTLDREARIAVLRWGLFFPIRTQVKTLEPFDAVIVCWAPSPRAGGRCPSREYVVRLIASQGPETYLDLFQVLTLNHAEELARETRGFLGFGDGKAHTDLSVRMPSE